MSPITFPETGFVDARYVGFSGQKMEWSLTQNFIESTDDLSLDLAGNSTVAIIDPGNDTFANGTIKTVAEQFQWFLQYMWVPGSERQSWWYIEGLPPFDQVNNTQTITAITQANPGVVTTGAAHGFENGDHVVISEVEGMDEVNEKWYTVANKAAQTFELTAYDGGANINTTGFGAWTAGGLVGKKPRGMNCVISDFDPVLTSTFAISKRMSVRIAVKVGRNLI